MYSFICFSGDYGLADYDYGVCGRTSQSEKCGTFLSSVGKTRTEVAFAWMACDGWELSVDDVLYNGFRMDAPLFLYGSKGWFSGKDSKGVTQVFYEMLESPETMTFWMVVVVILGFFICAQGLQNGVERITKYMMSALLVIMVVLAVRSATLPGASEGLAFYLLPSWSKMQEIGVGNVIVSAMNQAFFTLSLGIGAMAIFGSYIGKSVLCLESLSTLPY